MKNYWILFAGLFAFSFLPVKAQGPAKSAPRPEVIKLGKRSITLPPPAGFVSAASRFPALAARLRSATPAISDLVGAYVPATTDEDNPGKLDLFATVQIQKGSQKSDLEQEVFRSIIDSLEKNQERGLVFDPRSELVKTAVRLRLSREPGDHAKGRIPPMQSLGIFEKNELMLGSVFLRAANEFGEKAYLVGAGSMIYVGRRMLYVVVYKRLESEKDVEFVSSAAKSWTDIIISANRQP